MRWLRRLFRNRRGANLVEYVILIGVIAMVALVGFKKFGKSLNTKVKQQQQKVMDIGGSN
jgi:pilus assembly protein Flp/PilA